MLALEWAKGLNQFAHNLKEIVMSKLSHKDFCNGQERPLDALDYILIGIIAVGIAAWRFFC